jgi:DNA-directed RNA polymerase specialized sigma24 family protein
MVVAVRVQIPTNPEPADALAAVVELRRLADALEAEHVERAIREGWSLREIADVLGVSRQAVQKKHARRLKADGLDLRRRKDA